MDMILPMIFSSEYASITFLTSAKASSSTVNSDVLSIADSKSVHRIISIDRPFTLSFVSSSSKISISQSRIMPGTIDI